MGNYIGGWTNGNVVSEGTEIMTSKVTLWDMITHLVKQYILSKVEQDEFLREYLMGTSSGMNFFTMSQRAITFDPLPSRIKDRNKDTKRKTKKEYEIVPKETPYTRVRFEELSEDDEVIYYEEMNSSSEYSEELEEITPGLELYAAYSMSQK